MPPGHQTATPGEPNAAQACGATRPAGCPRPPGCCGTAGNLYSTPPASWSPCAPRNRTGPPAVNYSTHSARHTAWQLRGEEYSSTAATASGSRSFVTAASSSTRCMSSTPRQMLPTIPTTHWRAPNGRAGGRPRKYGLPTSPTDPPDQQTSNPRTLDRRFCVADACAICASGLAQIGQFWGPQLRQAIACRRQRWQREMAGTMVETRGITGGVDTHADVHVAAALDPRGQAGRRGIYAGCADHCCPEPLISPGRA